MARHKIKQRTVAAHLNLTEVQLSRLLNGAKKDPELLRRAAGVVDVIVAARESIALYPVSK